MNKTTIVVATYPGDKWIPKLKKHFEKIGIDNNSVIYKSPDEKKSFAENNNLGAKEVKTPYILFLNNDTEIQEDAIKNMEAILDSNKSVWIVGAKVYFLETVIKHVIFRGVVGHIHGVKDSIQCAGIQFTPEFKPYESGRGWKRSDPRVGKRQLMPGVTGACMMIRADKFLELGGFDEQFVNGWEDTDFCLRVLEEGGQIMYEPSAECGHYFGGSDQEGRFGYEDQNYNLWIAKWQYTGRVFRVLTYQAEP